MGEFGQELTFAHDEAEISILAVGDQRTSSRRHRRMRITSIPGPPGFGTSAEPAKPINDRECRFPDRSVARILTSGLMLRGGIALDCAPPWAFAEGAL
jgi:hypothetical protein